MSEWKAYRLGDLIEYKKGFGFKSSLYTNTGALIVRVSDMTDSSIDITACVKIKSEEANKLKEYALQTNDIIIATVGSWADNPKSIVGKVIKVPIQANQALLNQNAVRLRAVDGFSQAYLFYKLRDSAFSNYLLNNAQGSANQASVTLQDIFSYKMDVHPFPEQKAIAAVLSSLDDKIDLLHQQNATLEALAATLFRQWFVVEAQDDWVEGVLGDLVNFNYGKTLKDTERSGHGYPVYGSSGVVGYHHHYLIQAPGIITGRKGTLGIINYAFEPFYPIDTTFYITSKRNSDGLFFEYFLLKTLNLHEMNTDSAVPGLNRNLAHGIQLTIPPFNRSVLFNERVKPLFEKIKANQSQIRTLTTLRDTLLPKLMSGAVRVAL
jgi:type I restriction enzyme, S subunit